MDYSHNQNSCILDATNPHEGYVSKCGRFAAIRLAGSETKFVIIRDLKQVKVCRNYNSAINYINKLECASRRSGAGSLPI